MIPALPHCFDIGLYVSVAYRQAQAKLVYYDWIHSFDISRKLVGKLCITLFTSCFDIKANTNAVKRWRDQQLHPLI